METSLYLAQVFGIFYIISGVAVLLNRKEYKKIFSKFFKSKSSVVIFSMFILLLGLFIVLKHNIWEFTWVGLVTLLSWGILIKGATIVVFPSLIDIFEKKLSSEILYWVGGAVEVVVGIYLVYVGFFI